MNNLEKLLILCNSSERVITFTYDKQCGVFTCYVDSIDVESLYFIVIDSEGNIGNSHVYKESFIKLTDILGGLN